MWADFTKAQVWGGKNKLRMGIELNTKMKISKYQYAREEMGLIFGVWLWE
jgi:hypothetical protein